MAWLNTDFRFDARLKILTLSDREQLIHTEILENVKSLNSSPELLAAAISVIIVEARPDLAGCVLMWMNYAIESQRWEFGVSHASFPLVTQGEIVYREPLFPNPKENL